MRVRNRGAWHRGLRSVWLCFVVASCVEKSPADAVDTEGSHAVRADDPGHLCLDHSLDGIELGNEPDYWALRSPSTPDGEDRIDAWSRGEPCATAADREACLHELDATWEMDRGWGYQGATERAFMVSTRAGRVDRYDSNGSLLQLFDSLNQVEKMLFYLGVLGYVPRCETVEQDAAGVWRIEVDVVTSECPYITQHQSVQIHPNGTLHTLEVLQTERGPDCPRGAE